MGFTSQKSFTQRFFRNSQIPLLHIMSHHEKVHFLAKKCHVSSLLVSSLLPLPVLAVGVLFFKHFDKRTSKAVTASQQIHALDRLSVNRHASVHRLEDLLFSPLTSLFTPSLLASTQEAARASCRASAARCSFLNWSSKCLWEDPHLLRANLALQQ